MSIQSKTMLVKLSIRRWDGFKRDKEVTEHVDRAYHTDGAAGNYNKRLLSKQYLKKINKLASRIRAEHDRLTTPFIHEGVNVLAKALYFTYCGTMRDLVDQFNQAAQELVDQYAIELGERRAALRDMFNMEDYPTKEQLREKFAVVFDFLPMPASNHYILDLDQEEQEKLQSRLNEQLQDMHANGLMCIYKRVLEIVEHINERLSDPKNIFHNTMLQHAKDIAEALPGMNYYGDPSLSQIADEMYEKILKYETSELRENMQKRSEIARNAYAISLIIKEKLK